jgi:hypothetical protein
VAACVQFVGGQLQQIAGDATACDGYLLVTKDELAMFHILPPLTTQDGYQLSAAILGVWAAAFVIRVLAGRVILNNAEKE